MSREKITYVTRSLPTQLTPEEWADRAATLGEAWHQLYLVKSAREAMAAESEAAEKKCADHIAAMTEAVRTHKEARDVVCRERIEENRLAIDLVREDTGEVVGSRAMTTVEIAKLRQLEIPGTTEEAKSTKRREKTAGEEN